VPPVTIGASGALDMAHLYLYISAKKCEACLLAFSTLSAFVVLLYSGCANGHPYVIGNVSNVYFTINNYVILAAFYFAVKYSI